MRIAPLVLLLFAMLGCGAPRTEVADKAGGDKAGGDKAGGDKAGGDNGNAVATEWIAFIKDAKSRAPAKSKGADPGDEYVKFLSDDLTKTNSVLSPFVGKVLYEAHTWPTKTVVWTTNVTVEFKYRDGKFTVSSVKSQRVRTVDPSNIKDGNIFTARDDTPGPVNDVTHPGDLRDLFVTAIFPSASLAYIDSIGVSGR